MSVLYLENLKDPKTGRDPKIRGYCAMFATKSDCLFDGLSEVLAPTCFDRWLAKGRRANFVLNHEDFMGAARVWIDDVGVAFETEGILRMTDRTLSLVQRLSRGSAMGCSLKMEFVKGGRRTVEQVSDGTWCHIVREADIIEFGPNVSPAYQLTGCWLSSTDPTRMPTQILRLAYHWEKSAPVLKGTR